MQTGIGDTQNKWWQTYLSAGMATAPHPAQVDANGCIVEEKHYKLSVLTYYIQFKKIS